MPNDGIRFKSGKDVPTMLAKIAGFEAALDVRLEAAMKDAVEKVEKDAKTDAPVDTGALRASIASAVSEESDLLRGVIGSNMDYAPIQEVTQPYLRPAVEANLSWIVDRFESAVEEAAESVS